MPRIIIFISVIAVALGFILYQLSKFFLSINNGRNRLVKESIILRNKISILSKDLIPYTHQDLLDLSALKNNKTNIIGGYTTGVLTTIFSEEIISYGKVRLSANDYSVLVAKTSSNEIVYNDYNTHTQVLFDGILLGAIDLDGTFSDKDHNILAKIDLENLSSYKPIRYGEKEIGQVIQSTEEATVNTRAFQLTKPMDIDQEKYFIVLSLYLLLQD